LLTSSINITESTTLKFNFSWFFLDILKLRKVFIWLAQVKNENQANSRGSLTVENISIKNVCLINHTPALKGLISSVGA